MELAGIEIPEGKTVRVNANITRLSSGTVIDIPIITFRSRKPGPTLLLIAGMHGDEINGVEIIRRIVSGKLHEVQCGTVVCIPIINVYGFINFSRDVPDGKDINRSFPGSSTGSLASQVAYFLMEEIIPHIDYGIDFHTGGGRINNFPQVRVRLEDEVNERLAAAFGAPFTINSPFRDKSLRKEAFRLGKPILVYEGGESLRLRKMAIDEGIAGTRRFMNFLGMTRSENGDPAVNRLVYHSSWIRAKVAGLHFSKVRNGSAVEKGQVLGVISDPFGGRERIIKAPRQAHIIGVNNNPVVNAGDALFHIGW